MISRVFPLTVLVAGTGFGTVGLAAQVRPGVGWSPVPAALESGAGAYPGAEWDARVRTGPAAGPEGRHAPSVTWVAAGRDETPRLGDLTAPLREDGDGDIDLLASIGPVAEISQVRSSFALADGRVRPDFEIQRRLRNLSAGRALEHVEPALHGNTKRLYCFGMKVLF